MSIFKSLRESQEEVELDHSIGEPHEIMTAEDNFADEELIEAMISLTESIAQLDALEQNEEIKGDSPESVDAIEEVMESIMDKTKGFIHKLKDKFAKYAEDKKYRAAVNAEKLDKFIKENKSKLAGKKLKSFTTELNIPRFAYTGSEEDFNDIIPLKMDEIVFRYTKAGKIDESKLPAMEAEYKAYVGKLTKKYCGKDMSQASPADIRKTTIEYISSSKPTKKTYTSGDEILKDLTAAANNWKRVKADKILFKLFGTDSKSPSAEYMAWQYNNMWDKTKAVPFWRLYLQYSERYGAMLVSVANAVYQNQLKYTQSVKSAAIKAVSAPSA